MARSRNIKPGFFANDLLAEVHPLGRLLFAGLWTLADREGRLEDRPKKIKTQILPYDDCDADMLLEELANREFIRRYASGGLHVIQITNWHKHQNPHVKEPASTMPAPDESDARTVLLRGESGSSSEKAPDQVGLAPVEDDARIGPAPKAAEAGPVPVPVRTGADLVSAPEPTGSCPADSGFLIPDSPSPNPDSTPPLAPERKPAIDRTRRVPAIEDSDRRKTLTRGDSVIPSLGAIAKKVGLTLTPPEVAGYIMAHFPMQKVNRLQQAVPGDTGLTVDQVNCIVRHGYTLENARKAFEHFKQEQTPKKVGAWAFHCLKEELSEDDQIGLREETRSTQRNFKERVGRQLSGELQRDSEDESIPVSAPSP